jgi:hypothetical protein
MMHRLALAALLSALPRASPSNWAQISGDARQNVAAPAVPGWTRRWGHALASVETLIIDRTIDVLFDTEKSRLYVLGGDSWKRDTSRDASNAGYNLEHFFPDGRARDPNYFQADGQWADSGSGGLLNDIWWSVGASWQVTWDARKRNAYGEPLPVFVSTTSWVKLPDWAGLPPGVVSWREYIGCCHPNPNPCAQLDESGLSKCPTAFVCSSTDDYGIGLCLPDSTTKGQDAFAPQRRWSPRRGHAAVTVYPQRIDPLLCPSRTTFLGRFAPCGQGTDGSTQWPAKATLVVMGGRAISYERMLTSETNGGLLEDPKKAIVRERMVLMSDVWITADLNSMEVGGTSWSVANQGCWVAQLSQVKPPGVAEGACNTDYDCWANDLGDAVCREHACVCRHWSPRERFGAAVHLNEIYIAGGVRYSETLLCGDASCGTEYATFLNDVWVSTSLGVKWTELTPAAVWAPRADLALVWASNRLWVLGGQGGDVFDYSQNPLFSDSYYSKDSGATWWLNSTFGGWSARSAHAAVVYENVRVTDGRVPGTTRFVLLFGQEEVQLTAAAAQAQLTGPELVAAAAAQAPSNMERVVVTAYEAPPPGETVNSVRVVPVSTAYSLFPDADSATLADPLKRAPKIWWRDFDASGPAVGYIGLDDRDSFAILNFSKAMVDALGAVGVATVYELSSISADTVGQLRLVAPDGTTAFPGDICFEVLRAQYIAQLCSVRRIGYEGDTFQDTEIVESGAVVNVAMAPPVTGCEDSSAAFGAGSNSPGWESPTGTRYDETDWVCRQYPRSRRSFGAVLMSEGQGQAPRLYVGGGWEAANIFANDVWYRDERLPVGSFTRMPASMQTECIFEWTCADDLTDLQPACVFELRVTDVNSGKVLRDWDRWFSPLYACDINTHLALTRVDLRAIDPAGNRDNAFEQGRNFHPWAYKPPFPLVAVTVSLASFFGSIGLTLYAIRQYEKRVAYEKYLAKRLARKLKAEGAGLKKPVRQKGPGAAAIAAANRARLKREPAEKLRAHSESNKYSALLGARAGRQNREMLAVLEPVAASLSAKERFLAASATTKKAAFTQQAIATNRRRLEDEDRRAKNLLKARARMGGEGLSDYNFRVVAEAPQMGAQGATEEVEAPSNTMTLKEFNEAEKRKEEELQSERRRRTGAVSAGAPLRDEDLLPGAVPSTPLADSATEVDASPQQLKNR